MRYLPRFSQATLSTILATITLLIVAGPLMAAQVTLTSADLPYDARTGDTIYISGTHITSQTNGINFFYSSYVLVEGQGDTLEFGADGGDNAWGLYIQGDRHDITIRDITVMRNVGPEYADGVDNRCVEMGFSWNINFYNVNLIIDGHNGKTVRSSGGAYDWYFEGGTWISNSRSYTSRHMYDGANALLAGAGNTEAGSYRAHLNGVTIRNSPGQGIRIGTARFLIENCNISSDQCNDYPGGQSANNFALIVRGCLPGTIVRNNNIYSGSKRGGSSGILIENTAGTPDNPVLVYGNNISVHTGPDNEHFEETDGGLTWGTRFRSLDNGTVEYIHFFKNTVTITCDSDPNTTWYGRSGIAVHGEVWNGVCNTRNINIDSNTIVARDISGGCDIAGLGFTTSSGVVDQAGTTISNNRIISCGTIMRLAEYGNSNGCKNIDFRNNTIAFMDTVANPECKIYNPHTWYLNHYDDYATGNSGTDNTYENGAIDTDIAFWNGGSSADMLQRRTLNIFVQGKDSIPVQGALITVTNHYGQTIASAVPTDGGGRVQVLADYWYESNHDANLHGYNTFDISASYDSGQQAADSDTDPTFTVSWTSDGGSCLLTLPNTLGNGAWGGSASLAVTGDVQTEGSSLRFIVTLSEPVMEDISYSYSTQNGTATAPADYSSTSGTGIIEAGNTADTVVVPTVDDNIFEQAETFSLSISNPSLGTIGSGSANGTILDNDTDTGDAQAPDAIDDLTIGCLPGTDSLVLTWTATGDDGSSGTAAYYIIGWATVPITSANFPVNQVPSPPPPLAAGMTQSLTVAGPAPGERFFFAIKAYDDATNASPLSNVPSYSPDDLPDVVLSQPFIDLSNRQVTLSAAPFSQGCQSFYYEFQVDSFANFKTASSYIDSSGGTEGSVVINDLVEFQTYYWRCRAISEDASAAGNFTMNYFWLSYSIASGCSEPVLLSPSDGATVGDDRPLLTVQNIGDVSNYTYFFEISENPSFNPLLSVGAVPEQTGGSTSWQVDQFLVPGQTYYWRSRVNNCDLTAAWQFTLASGGEGKAVPNPFRPSLHSEVLLSPVEAGSQLTIMNVAGQIVRRFEDCTGPQVAWDGRTQDGSPAGSGVYTWYVQSAGGDVIVKSKVMLIR